jgi:hypothetical protein
MSLDTTRLIRGYLVSTAAITSLVPSSDIRVGWLRTVDQFPCITITQVAGGDVGYLGYNTSVVGSQLRRETATIQVDIYSKSSRLQTLQIADEIVPVMISGGCRKDSDVEDYNDELGIYRKIQTYSITQHYDD